MPMLTRHKSARPGPARDLCPQSWRRCARPAVVKPGDLAIQRPERRHTPVITTGHPSLQRPGGVRTTREMHRQRDLCLRVEIEAQICVGALALARIRYFLKNNLSLKVLEPEFGGNLSFRELVLWHWSHHRCDQMQHLQLRSTSAKWWSRPHDDVSPNLK